MLFLLQIRITPINDSIVARIISHVSDHGGVSKFLLRLPPENQIRRPQLRLAGYFGANFIARGAIGECCALRQVF